MPVEAGEAASPILQFCAGVGGIGTLCAMIAAALRKGSAERHSERVTAETLSLEDDLPWQARADRIEAYLRRIADNGDVILGLMRKRIESEKRMQIRAEERLRAQEEEARQRINERLARIDEVERRRRSTD